MTAGNWSGYDCWHRMFDEACNRLGHYDNQALAAEMCRLSGRNSKEDFEAAKKKLRQWRSGRRLPLRRNLAAISQVLGVHDAPDLQRQWEQLYAEAQARLHPLRNLHRRNHRQPLTDRVRRLWSPTRWDVAAAALIFGIGATVTTIAFERRAVNPALPEVGYDALVRLTVGSTRLVHGEHGSCDGPPPSWEALVPDLPASNLGIFSDGGLAAKMVNVCGKEMMVRAVRFTALKAGEEEVTLLEDFMRFEVLEPYGHPPRGPLEEKGP